MSGLIDRIADPGRHITRRAERGVARRQRTLPSSRPRVEVGRPEPPARIERLVGGHGLPDRLKGGVVALGNFDGVHRGHQEVVGRAVAMARELGVAAIVATFDPHPRRFFRPDEEPFRLTSLDRRQQLLGQLGVDAMMVFDFGRPLASVTPEQFVEQCLRNVGGVVTGADFVFGRDRAGDVRRLAEFGAELGFRTEAVDMMATRGAAVSSTRIRRALAAGDCAEACRLLSRPHAIDGVLGRGRRDDPDLPMLDAALDLGNHMRPRRGVYAVRATLEDGRRLGGSAFQPGSRDEPLELFLVDLQPGDVGRRATVEFLAHLHGAEAEYDRPALRQVIQTDRTAGFGVALGELSI